VTINRSAVRRQSHEERVFLARYDARQFPPVAVTVDIALLTIQHDDLVVLLVQRRDHPYKDAWALPGGFVREGEDIAAAAVRELTEETGLRVRDVHLEQLRAYGSPDRDPRMRVITIAYLGFMPNLPVPRAGGDAADACFARVDDLRDSLGRWPAEQVARTLSNAAAPERRVAEVRLGLSGDRRWTIEQTTRAFHVPRQRVREIERMFETRETVARGRGQSRKAPKIAFDHELIIADAVNRAGNRLEQTPIATAFVAQPFALSELRRVYEAVWGSRLDPANFRRKVLSIHGFVEKVGERGRPDAKGRPAELYRAGPATVLQPPLIRPGGIPVSTRKRGTA
jgi:8-oxo-dGTP diphosphatase